MDLYVQNDGDDDITISSKTQGVITRLFDGMKAVSFQALTDREFLSSKETKIIARRNKTIQNKLFEDKDFPYGPE